MLDQADIVEIALRGAAAGVNLLLAGLLLFTRPPGLRRLLGALFVSATVLYVLVSAERFEILGRFEGAAKIVAVYNVVFFWWFARSLFEDVFVWDWVKVVPFALITFLHTPLEMWRTPSGALIEQASHGSLSILLLAHAIWIALRDREADLVAPRRRFRLAFAVMVGVTGIAITVGENVHAVAGLPKAATLLHAAALFVLTIFFAFWLLKLNAALFAGAAPGPLAAGGASAATPQASALAPADKAAFDRLMSLMEAGAYREEGLTVAKLAEKVGVPEHQLRRLINRELGFRNFAAFLNVRRIEDAKAALADPANARRQVLQIALDLGYGSVGPFNRAFKEATGRTPTEFRKASQENG